MDREQTLKKIGNLFYEFRKKCAENTNLLYNKYTDDSLEKGKSITDYIADWHIAEIEKLKKKLEDERYIKASVIQQARADCAREILEIKEAYIDEENTRAFIPLEPLVDKCQEIILDCNEKQE